MSCGTENKSAKKNNQCNCSVKTCAPPKRRDPFLGTEDSQECKAERAFTMQAEQCVWDIGKPAISVKRYPLQKSWFRHKYLTDRYPFQLDHSGGMTDKRISWKIEVEKCDVDELLAECLEGLTDEVTAYYEIAHLALVDIMKHIPIDKVATALPPFALAFKKAALLNNETVARRLIRVVKEISLVQETIGPDLAYFMHDILMHLNQWMMSSKDNTARIVYEQKKQPQLTEVLDELLTILELVAGPERDFATRGMKLAIPNYQIPKRGAY